MITCELRRISWRGTTAHIQSWSPGIEGSWNKKYCLLVTEQKITHSKTKQVTAFQLSRANIIVSYNYRKPWMNISRHLFSLSLKKIENHFIYYDLKIYIYICERRSVSRFPFFNPAGVFHVCMYTTNKMIVLNTLLAVTSQIRFLAPCSWPLFVFFVKSDCYK